MGLAGCGDDKSPPVSPDQVGPRGALKSPEMQAQMQKGNPNGGPPPAGAPTK